MREGHAAELGLGAFSERPRMRDGHEDADKALEVLEETQRSGVERGVISHCASGSDCVFCVPSKVRRQCIGLVGGAGGVVCS